MALDALFGPLDQRQVEQSLYRVHGLTFVTALADERNGMPLFGRESRGQEWDFDQGGDTVGSTLRGLSLAKSQMEVRLQPAATTGYVEWTLRFNNVFVTDREARAIVQLPGGAVVSRVTLWIDGEPREAAFGGTAQVREAYQAIVNQRRDPLLVTWAGADRVLVQCFPVPARGGTMQVRLGITCPLQPTGNGDAALRLPSFVERNFAVSDELPLVLSAAADGAAVTLDQPRASQVPTGAPDAGLTTTVPTGALAGRPAVLRVHLPSESSPAWAAVPGSDGPRIVRQELVPAPAAAEPVFLVVNGSAAMAPWRDAIVAALARASADRLAGVALASDGVELAPEASPAMQATWLQTRSFAGGQDDTAALQAAVEALRSRGGGTVVWVHGPQALVWQDAKGLCTSLAGVHVRIAALPMAGTANVLARELALTGRLTALPQLGDPADDLRQALAGGSAPAALVSHYQIVSTADAETLAAGGPPSAEVAALWTRQEVDRLLAANQLAAAREHGIAARIVTPATGAVVLESRAQYEAAGLEPPPAPDAAVPEPATWVLIAGSGVLVFACLRRRPGSGHARGTRQR